MTELAIPKNVTIKGGLASYPFVESEAKNRLISPKEGKVTPFSTLFPYRETYSICTLLACRLFILYDV